MTAYAYTRVSTDDQANSGAGLAAQYDACVRYAETHGEVMAEVFSDEGVSGAASLDKRPALLEALAVLDKGDVLLVAKRDRLGRDPLVVAMIEAAVKRKGARIVSAAGEGTESDDPTSVLMRRIVDAFGEYERLVIGARTKAALQAKKARNERTGSVPYGKTLADDGVTLLDNQVEQEIIILVKMLRADGMSYPKIADKLTERGLKPRGAVWHAMTVKRIYGAA